MDHNSNKEQRVTRTKNPLTLEGYARIIEELATKKGWSKDWRWLVTGFFAESGELVNTIVHDGTEAKIADEFADVMHYLLQLTKGKCPNCDLDKALQDKINENYTRLKKTTNANGRIVRR